MVARGLGAVGYTIDGFSVHACDPGTQACGQGRVGTTGRDKDRHEDDTTIQAFTEFTGTGIMLGLRLDLHRCGVRVKGVVP